MDENRTTERRNILASLYTGKGFYGEVSSLVDFDAFIDIDGIDGLVHTSELSQDHVGHPSEVLHPGQKVRARVLEVDVERERIALSLKQTREEPGR